MAIGGRHLPLLALLTQGCATFPAPSATPRGPAELVRRYTPPGPAGDPWGPFIRDAAIEFAVPQDLLYAVMHAESRGCQWLNGHPILGKAGEAGLMQVPPSVYATLSRGPVRGGPDPFLPRDNIRAGAWALAWHIRVFGLPDALAAYQWSPTELASARSTGKPVPEPTQAYVRGVWADYQDRLARRARHRLQPRQGPTECAWAGRR